MLKFSRKAKGFYTAQVNGSTELALSNAGSVFGWSLVLRDAKTRKIVAQLGAGRATLTKAKDDANKLISTPQFSAFLLTLA